MRYFSFCSGFKNIFRESICSFLILLMAFQPTILLAQEADDSRLPESSAAPAPHEDEPLPEFLRGLEEQVESDAEFPHRDLSLIGPGKQGLRLYRAEGDQDVIDAEYPDFEGIPEEELPDVAAAEAAGKIKFRYNETDDELEILIYGDYKKDIGRKPILASHYIKGVQLDVEEGEPALKTSHLMILNSMLGTRLVIWPFARDLTLKSPIPFPPAMASPRIIDPNIRIKRVDLASPALSPRVIHDVNGNQIEFLEENDLIFQIERENGELVHERVPYHGEVVPAAALSAAGEIAKIELVNPSLTAAEDFAKAMRRYGQALEELESWREAQVLNSNGSSSDLIEHALRRIGEVGDLDKVIGFIAPPSDPVSENPNQLIKAARLLFPTEEQLATEDPFEFARAEEDPNANQLDQLATSPRFRWQIAGEGERWNEFYSVIREGQVSDAQRFEDGEIKEWEQRSWLKILISSGENLHEKYRKKKGKLREKLLEVVGRIQKKHSHLKTILSIGAILTGAAVVDRLNLETGNALTNKFLNLVEQAHVRFLQYIPGESSFQRLFESAPEALQTPYALTRISVAVGILIAFLPITFGISGLVAKAQGKDWSGTKATVNYMIRLYARVSNLIHHFVWKVCFRQHGLLEALQDEQFPMNHPAAWRVPVIGKSPERQEKDLEVAYEEHALRKQRAMIFAAALLSHREANGDAPIDPVTLLQLLRAHEEGRVANYLDSLGTTAQTADWNMLATMVYRELWRMGDRGIGGIDEQTVRKYFDVFERLSKKSKVYERKSSIRKAWARFKHFTGRQIFAAAIFGTSAAKVAKRYRNMDMDDRNVDTTVKMAVTDFSMSVGMVGIADASSHIAATQAHPVHLPRLTVETFDQVLIWTSVGAVDVDATNRPAEGVEQTSTPYINALLDRSRLPKDGGYGRSMGVAESIAAIADRVTDPYTDRGVIDTHLKKMKANIDGIQARFFLGLIPRIIGQSVIFGIISAMLFSGMHVEGFDSYPNWWELLTAAPKQLNVLLQKMTWFTQLAGTFAVGYASVWSFILSPMNILKDVAEENKALTERADYLVSKGLDENDRESLETGVELYQALYESQKRFYPERYHIPPSEFTPELAKEFQIHAALRPPVATIASNLMLYGLNVFGTLLSVALFVPLSKLMYDPTLPWPKQLAEFGKSLLYYTANYVGLLVGAKAVTHYLGRFTRRPMRLIGNIGTSVGKGIRRFGSACAAAIGLIERDPIADFNRRERRKGNQ